VIIKESAYLGLPTSFTYSDFFICALVLKFMLIHVNSDNVERGTLVVAATAFHGAYFSILMQSINQGVLESHGIKGAKAYTNKNYKRLNQIFRQAIYCCLLFFILVTVLPCFWLDKVLIIIGVEGRQLEIVKKLIYWSFPAMLLRVANDNLKAFIQNQDLLAEVGISNFVVFLIWLPISFLVVKFIPDNCIGYGAALLVYEIMCLLFNIRLSYKKCNKLTRDTSLPVLDGFGTFCCDSIKISMTSWLMYVFLDSMIIILQQVGNESQMATYSIFYNITLVIVSLVGGFIVYPRNIVNYFLAKQRIMHARRIFSRFFWVYLWFNFLIPFIISLILFIYTSAGFIEDEELSYWLKVSTFFIFTIGMAILQISLIK